MNHVAMSDFGPEAGPLGALLTDVQPKAGTYLPLPHEADYPTRYDIHADDVVGRLHVSARTATVDPTSDVRQVVLILTARGAPASGDIPGVLRFFDHGREWIVRGFDDLSRLRQCRPIAPRRARSGDAPGGGMGGMGGIV